jgi:RimJ/RimL family protein N-acetyltransferase
MIEHDKEPAGVIRLDYHPVPLQNIYIVSIYLAPDKYQKGIASIALSYINHLFTHCELHAEIHDKNIASQKLFLNQGYTKTSTNDLYIRYPITIEAAH